MPRLRLTLTLAILIGAAPAAQEPAITFDVVSVKPNLSGITASGTESLPDRINATNVTLRAAAVAVLVIDRVERPEPN